MGTICCCCCANQQHRVNKDIAKRNNQQDEEEKQRLAKEKMEREQLERERLAKLEQERLKQIAEEEEKERLRLQKLKEDEQKRKQEEIKVDQQKSKPIEVQKEPPTQEELDLDFFRIELKQQINTSSQLDQLDQFGQIFIQPNETENRQQQIRGPRIRNRRIEDYFKDMSKIAKFQRKGNEEILQETNNEIKIIRLLEKSEHSVCSYIGLFGEKLCRVKVIPAVNKSYIDQWIRKVNEVQSQSLLKMFLQSYFYYKKEQLKYNQSYCNLWLITELEQYNLYSFSIDNTITLKEKIMTAISMQQIIFILLTNKKTDQDKQNQHEKYFKNINTIKRNNILITIANELFVKISDWQLLLEEFKQLINFDETEIAENRITDTTTNLDGTSQLLITQHKLAQQQRDEITLEAIAEHFIIKVFKLLFYRLNLDLPSNNEVQGFVKEVDFNSQNIKSIFNIQENINEEHLLQLKETLNLPHNEKRREGFNNILNVLQRQQH